MDSLKKAKSLQTTKIAVFLILIQIICALSYGFQFTNNYIFLFCIYFIVVTIPFLLFFLFIEEIKIFRLFYKKLWFKFLLFICTCSYIVFSNIYASEVINNFFMLDSVFFPNTKILLTGIFSFNFIIYFYDFILFIFGYEKSLILILISLLIFDKSRLFLKKQWKLILLSLIYIIILAGFLAQTENNIKNKLISIIAQEFDFNKKNMCTNLNDITNLKGVIYLNNNKVLISVFNGIGFDYDIKSCDYKKDIKGVDLTTLHSIN